MNMKAAVEQDAPGQEEIPAAAVPLQEAENRAVQGRKRKLQSFPQSKKQLRKKRFFQNLFGKRRSGEQKQPEKRRL